MLRKSLLVILLTASLLLPPQVFSSATPTATAAEPSFTLSLASANLKTLTTRNMEGSLLSPLPELAKAADAKISQAALSRNIMVTDGSTQIIFTPGSALVTLNGERLLMEKAAIYIAGVLYVPTKFFCDTFELVYSVDKDNKLALTELPPPLPVIGSYANLQSMLEKQLVRSGEGYNQMRGWNVINQFGESMLAGEMLTATTADATAAAPMAKTKEAGDSADYSGTNVQVQGVDEADIVKTDGSYLYQVNRQRIAVVSAVPETAMKVVSMLRFEEHVEPRELYVDGDTLVVIAANYSQQAAPYVDAPEAAKSKRISLPYYRTDNTLALVYDIGDKAHIRKVREVEIAGSYLQSRKIGSSVYLIANQYMNFYPFLGETQAEPLAPQVRDSAASPAFRSVPYSDIRYFPGSESNSYLTIAGFSLDRPQEKALFHTYLGAGQEIYASQEHLYVTVGKYTYTVQNQNSKQSSALMGGITEISTDIYKFALDNGVVRYAAKGNVPGTILNQFSMDEHKGYFRIATTKGETWRDDAYTSKNNVYVLDSQLAPAGKLEDLAPGERIYSVRFMGDRGYLVTFKQVDPLFVIDLAVPEQPKVLGELKIPGYSDYLHPYDETHIIGFGKDTVELDTSYEKNGETTAFYQGMKLAIFDVSDVSKPKEMFKEIIGDRGTDSPLLYDHKALLFSREKNLLAFPITRLDLPVNPQTGAVETTDRWGGNTPYGEFAFQGAYVYNIDLTHGFRLKASITHMSEEAVKQASTYGFDYTQTLERILYIGNTLYTLSPGEIRANNLDSLAQTGQVLIPE